jgi:CheY-like chemotaxis protein
MKRVLIVEDNSRRQAFFLQGLAKCALTIVETAEDAIHKLKSSTWDCLFLDHDLGEEAGSGYEVAKFLEEFTEFLPEKVYIHSANSVGVKYMQMAIPSAVVVPGAWANPGVLV